MSSLTEFPSALHQSQQQLPSCVDLATQLNIEQRLPVGGTLLATADILQVRPDVGGRPENFGIQDVEYEKSGSHNAAGYCQWQAGLQETAGSVAELTCPFEIDLNYHSYAGNHTVSLPVLEGKMVEQELEVISGTPSLEDADENVGETCLQQSTTYEDFIEGPLPSAGPNTAVPDSLNFQLSGVKYTLPYTVDKSSENNISHSALPHAAYVVKSVPVQNGLVQSALATVEHVEQIGQRDTRCMSLPLALSLSSSCNMATPLPTFLTELGDMAQKTATSQQKPNSDHQRMDNSEPVLKSQFLASEANAKLLPAAMPAACTEMNVVSPVGQITEPMSDLSIDNNHYPLLRGVLTEATEHHGGRDQTKNLAFQVSFSLCFISISVSLYKSTRRAETSTKATDHTNFLKFALSYSVKIPLKIPES